MYNPRYLTLSRHHVYYFRWPLPKSLHRQGRARDIKVSLRTREPKEALRLANILSYYASVIMKQADGTLMEFGEIQALLRDYFQELVDECKAQIHRDGPLPALRVNEFLDDYNAATAAIEQEHDEIAPGEEMHERLAPIIDRFDLSMPEGSEDYQSLKRYYKYAFQGYCQKILQHNQKQLDFPFITEPSYLKSIYQNHKFTKPENRLEKVCTKYIDEKVRAGAWSDRPLGERRDCLSYLMEALGSEFDLLKIDPSIARRVKDMLLKTPKNRNKKKETRGRPLSEQVELEGFETLAVASINKYLQCYSGLFDWAIDNGYVASNPFKGLMIAEPKKKRRFPFSADQISTIFEALDSYRDGYAPKGLLNSETRYWGVLIAMYTGARLNEIASLTCDDIRQDQESGVWYFDINDEEKSKRLKTDAAWRNVPIHPALKQRGILEYVEAASKRNNGNEQARLLPDLTYSPQEGWGRKLGRWFNDSFLPMLEIKRKGVSFHSWRHTVITALRSAGISNHDIRALVGHEPDGVTEGVYKHSDDLKVLFAAIEKLDYGDKLAE